MSPLVAYAFKGDISPQPRGRPQPSWRERMLAVGVVLLIAFIVFSLLRLTLSDPHDFVAVFLAFLILIPSICVVPYCTGSA